METPTTEGPRGLERVLARAARRKVPVHRVSQASGIMLMTDDEISEMVDIGIKAAIDVNLLIGRGATYDIGAQAYTAAGKTRGLGLRGADQLVFAMEDLKRAVRLGLRSVLVSDIGILQVIARQRSAGQLPPELIIKTSVMMAPTNPASAQILQTLGADTINIPSDLTIPQIAAMRSAIHVPIDFYVEAPDNIGGFVRYYRNPDVLRVAAPRFPKLRIAQFPPRDPPRRHPPQALSSP